MEPPHGVRVTAGFEQALERIDDFLAAAGQPQAFDALLDELSDQVVPNLGRFPRMGRAFLAHSGRSVETVTGLDRLSRQLESEEGLGELREYVLVHYVLLYLVGASTVDLLSIRHHRQLSFDFHAMWPASP